MAFATNGYVHDLVTKQDFNIDTFLFEAFKRTAYFYTVKDFRVEGLNQEDFIQLLKKVAYTDYKGEQKSEISAESYNELQGQIQAVQNFCRQLPNVKMKTKLEPVQVSFPKSLNSFIPKELFTELDEYDEAMVEVKEAYYNNPNDKVIAKKYRVLDAKRDQYIARVKIAYVQSLTPEQKQQIYAQIQSENISYAEAHIAEYDAAKQRYMEALEILSRWQCPEYDKLKEWLIRDINTGITKLDTKRFQQDIAKYNSMTAQEFFDYELKDLIRREKVASETLTKSGKSIK